MNSHHDLLLNTNMIFYILIINNMHKEFLSLQIAMKNHETIFCFWQKMFDSLIKKIILIVDHITSKKYKNRMV